MTTIRILHVDDDLDIREVVELSLGMDPDFMLQSCGSGREALAVAAEWQPDLILLDVMMPVMDGPATLVQLRENVSTASIPVIFMTARAQAREVDRLRGLGAVGVMARQQLDQSDQARAVVVEPGHVLADVGAVRLDAIAKLRGREVDPLAEPALVQQARAFDDQLTELGAQFRSGAHRFASARRCAKPSASWVRFSP